MEQKNTAKTAFLYFLSLIALIFFSLSLGTVIFQIINRVIEMVGEPYRAQYSLSALRWGIATLLIAAPIYLFSVIKINKSIKWGGIGLVDGMRRWLTYFIVLVAAVVGIGYLIGLVYSFLEGELTTKFSFKVLTALIITGSIFAYYLTDIKREKAEGFKVEKIYVGFMVVAAILAFVLGLYYNESPWLTRQKQQDREVVERINMAVSAVDNYYNINSRLPENLDELKRKTNYLGEDGLLNPVSGEEFEYEVLDEARFSFCSEFQRDNSKDEEIDVRYGLNSYIHEAGRDCFEFKAGESGLGYIGLKD